MKTIYPQIVTKLILKIVATLVVVLIVVKSFVDGNSGGDAWAYHMPFAARLWGIVPSDVYAFEYVTEKRFQGFPLLAEFLQGFFWFVFQKTEATNLVCSLSLVSYIFFLKFYLQIPLYLSALTLLAVPMIHMHATSSYVDLPANICASITILITYLLYTKPESLTKRNLSILILSACGAANMKHGLVPIVFLVLCFAVYQISYLYLRQNNNAKSYLSLGLATLLSGLLIFATPVKNTILYGNPFYPVEVKVAGLVLNHAESVSLTGTPAANKVFRTQRWVKSLLEINAFDKRRPWPWSLAMDFIPLTDDKFGIGGYFAVYVVFNVLLFLYLCWRNWCRNTKVAAILLLIMSAVTSVMPESHELRYYMYWMISLVSLNSYLVCGLENSQVKSKVVNSQSLALVGTAVMISFMILTRYWYTIPEFSTVAHQVKKNHFVEPNIFSQIHDGDRVCIVGKTPFSFFYISKFHPPLKYSVKAEFYDEKLCGNRKILK